MKILERPRLTNPVLIAGWPGMGLVAYKSVAYLIENLETRPLAQFDIPDLYQVRGVNVMNGIVEAIEIPKGTAFYRKKNKKSRDLILFLGDEQPVAGKELIVSRDIIEMAREFGCNDIYTFAAMVTGISHHAVPKVWGCSSRQSMLEKMKSHNIAPMADGQISGLNGLLVGFAASLGMETACLLGELPYYATQIAYYPASCAVLEKFAEISEIEIDLEAMKEKGRMTMIEIDTYIEQIKREASRKKEEYREAGELEDPTRKEPDEEDLMN